MTRKLTSFCFVVTLMLALVVPDAVAQTVKLASNTVVPVRTTAAIYSDQVQNGEQVSSITVARDVEVDGQVVIASGAGVRAQVTRSSEAGRVGQPGDITIDLLSTTAVDGSEIDLSGNYSAEGKGKVGASVAISLILCPLALLMKGDEGSVPSGSETRALTVGSKTVSVGADTASADE